MSVYEDWHQSDAIYRVHDILSPTVHCHYEGFTADHPDFGDAFGAMFPDEVHAYDEVSGGLYPLKDILNHVLGWSNRHLRQPSKFISVTEDLDYAIWEVVRRLNNRRVEVNLSFIKACCDEHGLLLVDPVMALRAMPRSKDVNKAIGFANSASEILILGRIYRHCIAWTGVWTEMCMALDLPDYFFRVGPEDRSEHWMSDLIWDYDDNLRTFREKLEMRKVELEEEKAERNNHVPQSFEPDYLRYGWGQPYRSEHDQAMDWSADAGTADGSADWSADDIPSHRAASPWLELEASGGW